MAANSIIEQKPPAQIWQILPVGQELIFVVSNQTAVANETKVKFVAEVHISDTSYPNLNTTTDLIGTFKTTPNNAGVGIYNLRNVVENYVSADNMAANGSSYKGTTTSATARHPLHLIDKYSLNDNIVRYMAIRFSVEYKGATDVSGNSDVNTVAIQAGTETDSRVYAIFNGYIKYTDVLTMGTGVNANDFGFDMSPYILSGASSTKKLFTNAPEIQYANIDDYGTISFWDDAGDPLRRFTLSYYDSSDSLLGIDLIERTTANGAYDTYSINSNQQLLHLGCFPANLQNWASTFRTLVAAGTVQGGYYFISAVDFSAAAMTQTYRINLNCPDAKGYESIRLCWLNQWGCWDYYTFTKKSVKSFTTQGTTYDQLGGTWNQSYYSLDSYKGGKKTFRVNTTEKIIVNTDFTTEDNNVMFEELINSPEVYILEGYQTDTTNSALNQYVTPTRILTSNFIKKTIANDKLIQYTFEIEKSKTLRTQSV
tara:strand:- start:2969 stop:4417 length:1449 start_codon:yes stop_codon:yes gene_type:complete